MSDSLLSSGYDPKEVEPKWYPLWLAKGHFKAEDTSSKPPFSIVIPPPNVTGSLHMGHALMCVIEDVLIRHARMKGCNTLWLPGTDHAGIATQMVVEHELQASQGKSRHDVGREAFLARVWEWKERHGSRITEQMKVLGCSLDWDRERFTLDPGLSVAVREVFVRLHDEGLIYRAERLINWCPRCSTALSDLEVDHDEGVAGAMWDFAYPLQDGGEIVVSTTRPETMLGDTAVAVHPDDERYKHLIGRKIRHPFADRDLLIVADAELVDPEFGTGAVKVTPAHDFNDFETGLRHNLPMISMLDRDARVVDGYGPFSGLDRLEARERVLEALEERGLGRGRKDHEMSVGGCQRCGTVVEPTLSTQWFVNAKPLADRALDAVRDGRTTIVPAQYEKVYYHWLENIRDWCISRQLWWGHRIPAWHCDACDHVTVAREDPTACGGCGGGGIRQDEDVLDTWFSSALWPFSTLGWPERTPALKTFYPTDVMETGYDILFFWVARMMMMGLHFMDDVPFRTVYLHGMVRDKEGNKMSKTRGNVIDPLVVTEEQGADALRFALAAQAGQGRDVKLTMKSVEGYRNFCNKIWNAVRFSLPHLDGVDLSGDGTDDGPLSVPDRWIRARCDRAVAEVSAALDAFRLNDAASAVYQFFWHELCDWYLEMSKPVLYGDPGPAQTAAKATLGRVLGTAIRLLNPLMPYLTEELWARLPREPGTGDSECIVATWPEERGWADNEVEAEANLVMDVTTAIRNVRAESHVPAKARPEILIKADAAAKAVIEADGALICELARAAAIGFVDAAPDGTARTVTEGGVEIFLPLAGLVDTEAEGARLQKAIDKLDGELKQVRGKLGNPNFVDKAPAAIVDKERGRLAELEDRRGKLVEGLQALGA